MKIPVDHIICGDYVLPMDQSFTVIEKGAVAINGNKILDAGPSEEISGKYIAGKISAGEGKAVLPASSIRIPMQQWYISEESLMICP